tara:strand:- start:6206 stop:6445 length:240 start_codon:yes stop_codon:yes gene_type:complete
MINNEKNSLFLNDLYESLDLDNITLDENTLLSDIGWDSLALISCIALADEHFNVTLSGKELSNLKTTGDILNLISEKNS